MEFLPLFFKAKGNKVLVSGNTDEAARKIELLLRAGCLVIFDGTQQQLDELKINSALAPSIVNYDSDCLVATESENIDWKSLRFVVSAHGDESDNRRLYNLAIDHNLPINVANHPELSHFVFPSIVDRSPVIAAVSSSGELPVLTRLLRSRLESTIPHAFGRMATLAASYRAQVKNAFSNVNSRRRFWESQLEGNFAELVFSGREEEAKATFEEALNDASRDASNGTSTAKGEVYLVGAGPGDPDLLSFKALRLMRQADVVLYDRLVSDDVMRLVRQDAELVNVGKERSNHTLPQESINQLLLDLALQGKRVLRLKGGDPFIFGRGGEEIDLLAEHQVAFQVVPGVTAAAGCGAYAGIPLTHRDYSQSVRFITGHLKNNTSNLPWPELVHEHQTLVFYMGLASLDHICSSLIEHGMRESMPAALVSKGTTRQQKVVTGKISNLYELSQATEVKAPTIIIVGEVVTLRDRLNWRD